MEKTAADMKLSVSEEIAVDKRPCLSKFKRVCSKVSTFLRCALLLQSDRHVSYDTRLGSRPSPYDRFSAITDTSDCCF